MVSTLSPPVLAADPAGLGAAAEVLHRGGLVGLPTETVYGLAGDALRPEVVARIFAAKGRPADNPLIIHVAGIAGLERLVAEVTPLARSLAGSYWPGPLTVVLDAAATVPSVTRGGLSTVAVRVPDHPVATTLLETTALALAAPSANRSGRPSPTRPEHVAAGLGAAVDLVLDGGPCAIGVESTVVDARGRWPVVLRDGLISREELGVAELPAGLEVHRSPGTRYAHYTPRCAVEVVHGREHLDVRVDASTAAGERVGVVADGPALAALGERGAPVRPHYTVRADDEVALARSLYGSFLEAEDAGVDRLLVLAVPERGVGRAVMDRLRRAAAGR
jgi:L-threonylcarbamoyladenylate synthase